MACAPITNAAWDALSVSVAGVLGTSPFAGQWDMDLKIVGIYCTMGIDQWVILCYDVIV